MSRCYIIAEVGLSHMGDMERARRSVLEFAEAGADAVKFQDHSGQYNVPADQAHPSPHVSVGRAEWYRRTSFTWDQWKSVRDACERSNVDYIVSPFSVEALQRQVKLEPRYIKIASGEVTNRELIKAALGSGVPVLYSTGMSDGDGNWHKVTRMRCTSEYPCAPEHSRLDWAESEHASVYGGDGFAWSDHTQGIWFPIAAVAYGCTLLEKHVHLDAARPHSDSDIALTPDKFCEMVEGIRAVEKALYEPSEPDLTEIRKVYLHAP